MFTRYRLDARFGVRRMAAAIGAVALLALAVGAQAAEGRIYAEDGVALGGTDPVAYFELGEAAPGEAEHSLSWRGAEWRFANARHRERFAADPEAYAPAYGGWCAWAAARGYDAPTSPEAWSIVDGRLFLNYDADIQARWEADRDAFIREADRNWPNIF